MSDDKDKKESNTRTPMEELLGMLLITDAKDVNTMETKATKQLFDSKELVALYFSASWCPPCQAFTPKLITFYDQLKKANEGKSNLEIVYVSSDKNLEDFYGYYKKMPWLAIPTDANSAQIKQTLATKFQIRGIPSLIVLDVKTGQYITDNARNDVMSAAPGPKQAMEVYQKWKSTTPVPIEEAPLGQGSGGGSFLMQIIQFFLKNPMYIIGLLYLYKSFMRSRMKSPDPIEEDVQDVPPVPVDEQEF